MLTPLPHGLTIEENPNVLKIVRKWFNISHIPVLVFAAFWNGFLVVWYSLGITAMVRSDSPNGAFIMMFLFPLLHVAVGIGMLYYGLSGLLNKTTIEVVQGLMKVNHGPMPWFGNKEIPVAAIKQLYCNEVYRSTKSGHYYTFDVNIVSSDNKQVKLVKGLSEKAQALFIEDKIEEYLKIKNEQVSGEINRT